MAYKTLTYSETSKGFPSFYSFEPESILGLNNFLYTFKGGNLYRHNSGSSYATFYGTSYSSTVSSVFNEAPLQAKLFKTLELHSDRAWTASSIQGNAPILGKSVGGDVQAVNFEQKEGAWFSYIRNDDTTAGSDIPINQYGLRSVKGIGLCGTVAGVGTANCTVPIVDALGNPLEISSTISVGDYLYQCTAPLDGSGNCVAGTQNIGLITSVNHLTGVIEIDNTAPFPNAVTDRYTLYVQDAEAESHGIIGQYLEFTLTLTTTSASELFAVKSDIMKSYP